MRNSAPWRVAGCAVAAALLAEIAPPAYEAGVRVELVDGEEVEVTDVPALLHALLRNLVDNAIR
ncbi:MAG: hypothetical protein ACJ8NR_04175 [Sulfurifustis sp.]